MGLLKKNDNNNYDDNYYLSATPISKKRMDLLWLDPPKLAELGELLGKEGAIVITLGPNESNLRDHEVTLEDYTWAKEVEKIVDKAFLYGQRKEFRKSMEFYKEALQLAPGCDLFLMSVGVCYTQMGKNDKAVLYLKRAHEISPDNNRILNNLNAIK